MLSSIPVLPRTDPEHRAVSYLFNAFASVSYVVPYPGWGPFIRYLPRLLAKSDRGSALQAATHALAFCITALQPELSSWAVAASRWYGEALWKTNAAVADRSASLSNDTLMAVLLLSVYEVSVLRL